MQALRRIATIILPVLLLLVIVFLESCQKKVPPPLPSPQATAQPAATGLSLAVPQLSGLSLNGQAVEQVAARFQDPQSLDNQDLSKAFGIADLAYLDQAMKLIGEQLKIGTPLKWISVYFGGAPKELAARCVKDAGGGICLIEPYAFNCADAISQRNWTEENYLKLCQRLGRLKAYKSERLVALFSGDNTLGYVENTVLTPEQPVLEKKPVTSGKGRAGAHKAVPTPAPAISGASKPGARTAFPEMTDLMHYLQGQGIFIAWLSDQEKVAAVSTAQAMGLDLSEARIAGRDTGDNRLLAAVGMVRNYLAEKNRQTVSPEGRLNLEDLRLVLLAEDEFAPIGGSNIANVLPFLENASTVPGGADLLFLHPHIVEPDQKLARKRNTMENFQNYLSQESPLHPTRMGVYLQQPVVSEVRATGAKGGFLSQNPAAAPESLPTESQLGESQPTESLPSGAESKPSGAESPPPIPGTSPGPAAGKPVTLPQPPPAPPPDLGKDAL